MVSATHQFANTIWLSLYQPGSKWEYEISLNNSTKGQLNHGLLRQRLVTSTSERLLVAEQQLVLFDRGSCLDRNFGNYPTLGCFQNIFHFHRF